MTKELKRALDRVMRPDFGAAAPVTGGFEIEGTVKLGHSNQIAGHENEKKVCICCPDFPSHVYQVSLDLPPYPTDYPEHFGRDLNLWVKSMFDFKKLEGRKIRITAELVD